MPNFEQCIMEGRKVHETSWTYQGENNLITRITHTHLRNYEISQLERMFIFI